MAFAADLGFAADLALAADFFAVFLAAAFLAAALAGDLRRADDEREAMLFSNLWLRFRPALSNATQPNTNRHTTPLV
jgi:hypothetical protein